MATIMLSIKPEYSSKILSGEKKYEYRKHLPQKPIKKIIIYSTSPEKKIVGEVSVNGLLTMSPSQMWKQTKSNAGISRSKYRLYFKGCKEAFAYKLGDVVIFNPPKSLSDYNIAQAPQSFVYIGNQ